MQLFIENPLYSLCFSMILDILIEVFKTHLNTNKPIPNYLSLFWSNIWVNYLKNYFDLKINLKKSGIKLLAIQMWRLILGYKRKTFKRGYGFSKGGCKLYFRLECAKKRYSKNGKFTNNFIYQQSLKLTFHRHHHKRLFCNFTECML